MRRRHAVRAEDVEAAFTAAIEACRVRVAPWVSLPPGERVTVSRVTETGAGAEARAISSGGMQTELRLDTHALPDIARLVWLAAHESYAGHHLQHVLAAGERARGSILVERQLEPVFGLHLLCAEGAAEAGASLLLEGSSFAELCRVVSRVAGLQAAAVDELVAIHRASLTLDLVIPQVAERYLDGDLGQAAAIERLATDGLVADAASFMTAVERQRTRLLAYPAGRRLVTQALGSGPPQQQWQRLSTIATTLSVV